MVLSKGAKMLVGKPDTGSGLFATPTVLGDAGTTMQLVSEETFGPVAPLFRFRDETQAIEIANATPWGLASYFFTNDMRRSWRVAERLEFGMVGLNTVMISMEVAPFGGVMHPVSAARAPNTASRNISR
jgi:succinate-semialdehyde dehydrogenase / glutarate-semialdehyde dehydrogenase